MCALLTDLIPDKPPIICVVTVCVNELDMNQWAETNRAHFERNQMFFGRILGTCFACGGRLEKAFAPLRKDSGENLCKIHFTQAKSRPSVNRRSSQLQCAQILLCLSDTFVLIRLLQ